MIPKKIVMENFGPFLHEEVDFQEFHTSPLFLISGKTGAGKTTIFDALTFALFGDASGGVRNANEIRSDFADPTEETRVSFTFEHQGHQYVIVRSPKQTLQKKNGKGATVKNQKVQLTVLDDTGREVEAYQKVETVQSYIYDLLHLTKEQFRQILMLPQGEFRTFLIANSTEKEAVLRSLFGTAIYRQFNEKLKLKKQELEKSVAETATRIDQLFQQIPIEQGASYLESIEQTKQYLEEEKEKTVKLAADLQQKDHELKEQQQALEQAKQLADQFQQYEKIQKDWQELQQELPVIEEQRKRLNEGEKLQQIRPPYERVNELDALLLWKEKEIQENQASLKRLSEEKRIWQMQEAALVKEEQKWEQEKAELVRLSDLLPAVQQYAHLMNDYQKMNHEQQQREAEQAAYAQTLEQLSDQLNTLKNQQETKSFWIERRYKNEQLIQQAQTQVNTEQNLEKLEEQMEEAQIHLAVLVENISQTSKRLNAANQEVKTLRDRWARSEIARLSMDLIDGEACPVCGSKDHPDPALHETLSGESLKELQHDLEAKEKNFAELQKVKETYETKREFQEKHYEEVKQKFQLEQTQTQLKQQELKKAVASLYQQTIPEELPELVLFLQKKQTEAQAALEQLTAAELEIGVLTEQQNTVLEQHQSVSTKLSELTEQVQMLKGRLALTKEQVKDWEAASLEEHIHERTILMKEYQKTLKRHEEEGKRMSAEEVRLEESKNQLSKQYKTQLAEQEKWRDELDHLIVKLGLNKESISEQLSHQPQLEELRQAIQEFLNRQLLLSDQKERLKLALADQTEPPLEQLSAKTTQMEEAFQELQQVYYQSENQLHTHSRILTNIESLHQNGEEQLNQLSEITQLYQTINGDNPEKISLERYILQSYLEEILQAANQQLSQLTKGRYQFELNDQIGRSKGNTGLEINVYDDNSGIARSAQTLSGGESFIAALSLVLGLAEVIQNQSGGITMETLFIDEGFGSLDEEALEIALEALAGIENHGRMIGLISHVKELKERIPQQIIVQTTGTGQSTIHYQLEEWHK
ncbi:nuclease SbcCD subunit C [Enterococcus florum]|uniref:Nuclease SbcCD subunit C n=1 Tax=Enterococcus florum TaxID=2480627 RepID=A0A4P5P911_9ENTE|nr:AAA family ATPase [Enterococcus florum]GCF94036.1 nuclease SbcCD subunit C [Enterococcus florum]